MLFVLLNRLSHPHQTTLQQRKELTRKIMAKDDDDEDIDDSPGEGSGGIAGGGSSSRKRPNVLITGTPGVGKTATASLIAVRKNGEKKKKFCDVSVFCSVSR